MLHNITMQVLGFLLHMCTQKLDNKLASFLSTLSSLNVSTEAGHSASNDLSKHH